jgi:hypothetical protein
MPRQKKTQSKPAESVAGVELDKPAAFVSKVNDIANDFLPATSPGRPSKYDPKFHVKTVRNMAKVGLSEAMMSRILGINPSTFAAWKAQHSALSKALEYGREVCNGALEATAIQRALGYSYETEKAFQTGVKLTVTETLPPNEYLLKFLLERRMGEQYRPTKEVVHTHNAGALFQSMLQRMDAEAKLRLPAPQVIDVKAEGVED